MSSEPGSYGRPDMKHPPVECKRMMGLELHYSFKNWSDRFKCPVCEKSKRQSLNFLGSRVLTCDGENISITKKVAVR
jgi:hypothetical protein